MDISLQEQKSIFKIIKESFWLYYTNFIPYTKELIYPIMAHLIGISWIIFISSNFHKVLPEKTSSLTLLVVLLGLCVTIIPGFILFLSGFWRYLVVIVSLCTYTKDLVLQKSDLLPKFYRNEVLKKKKSYVLILSLMMLIWTIALITPYASVIMGYFLPDWFVIISFLLLSIVAFAFLLVISIYLSLTFQVFAFENQTLIGFFKRSLDLVQNNFFRTSFLIIILAIITGGICPFIIHFLLDILGIVNVFALIINSTVEVFLNSFMKSGLESKIQLSQYIASACSWMLPYCMEVSRFIVISTIDAIVTVGMLPLGSACFTLFYFDLVKRKESMDDLNNV